MAWLERFAPSPTGPLHLGHAFSALTAWDRAAANGGQFLLRIEDIDQSRARPEWEAQIYDDLHWLGLDWPEPLRQSTRMPAYRAALQTLWDQGLLYVCTCSRRDIEEALTAPQEGAPMHGPDGLIYPGTCRCEELDGDLPDQGHALRLNIQKSLERVGDKISFTETGTTIGVHEFDPEFMLKNIGDVVLARRGMGTSYHLSVVIDDAFQGITHVTRGVDLQDATQIHRLLQILLGLPAPQYHHHRLIRDEAGKRLAKRDDARAIAKFRAEGATPADIRAMVMR